MFFVCPALWVPVVVLCCRCAGRVEVRVARAGDIIEESPGGNASVAANGVRDASEGIATVAESEVSRCTILKYFEV